MFTALDSAMRFTPNTSMPQSQMPNANTPLQLAYLNGQYMMQNPNYLAALYDPNNNKQKVNSFLDPNVKWHEINGQMLNDDQFKFYQNAVKNGVNYKDQYLPMQSLNDQFTGVQTGIQSMLNQIQQLQQAQQNPPPAQNNYILDYLTNQMNSGQAQQPQTQMPQQNPYMNSMQPNMTNGGYGQWMNNMRNYNQNNMNGFSGFGSSQWNPGVR